MLLPISSEEIDRYLTKYREKRPLGPELAKELVDYYLELKRKEVEVELEVITGEKRHPLKALFDILKKFIDILDDVWAVLKGALPPQIFNLIGPFLTGGVGFVINLVEAYQGLKEAWLAKRSDDTIRQRKTRGITGLLIFALGGTGAGLSLSFIASAFGAVVSGTALMPMLIPIFLISIYSVALWKRSYIFHQAKVDEEVAKRACGTTSNHITPTDEFELFKQHINSECQKQNYSHYREERLKAERNVAFNVIEVVASSIVLVGTILGLSALIGAASFATLGFAPLGILIVGVSIGLFCKAFERYDEKHEFVYTRKARVFIQENMFEPTLSSTARLFQTIQPQPRSSADTPPPTQTIDMAITSIPSAPNMPTFCTTLSIR